MNYEMLYKLCDNPSKKIDKLPLSPNEFFYFLFPGKLNGNIYVYDKKEYQAKRKKLISLFGDKETEIIHSAGMAFLMNYVSKKRLYTEPDSCLKYIDNTYKAIIELPIEILTKSIGAGYTGVVFTYQVNKIIKLMYNSFIPNELKFFSFQKMNQEVIFPKIYDYNNDFIIMEKLETDTQHLIHFRKKIRKYIIQRTLGELSYREVNSVFKNSLPTEIASFLSCIRREFIKIFGVSSIGDLKDSNIGERTETGELVYFDPIGGIIKES